MPAIQITEISKTFEGQRALDRVSTTFEAGRITALLGQNGSGKSTLIKILAGFHAPDPGGSTEFDGAEMRLPLTARAAHAAGLRFLHQDLAVVPDMTVIENFALVNGYTTRHALGPIRSGRERLRATELLRQFDIGIHPETLVGSLAPSQRTMVAIVRAFAGGGDSLTLILDEPTASLPEAEVERIFGALRTAVEHGAGVIYVSHRIDEVQRLADHLVVLRDGQVVADRPVADLQTADVVRLIVGRDVSTERVAPGIARTDDVLQVKNLHGRRLSGISMGVGRGEILGIAGLLGCGRSELARMVAGAQPVERGAVIIDGRQLVLRSPREAMRAGVGYVPQDRRVEGIIAAMSTGENLTLPVLDRFFSGGRLRTRSERSAVQELLDRFRVKPPDPGRTISTLSGGNQQKVVFGRSVQQKPRVLVLDEPSQGIDVGAREEIAQIVLDMAYHGVGVLIGSSDNAELARLCDRVLVLDRGALVEELTGPELTEARLTAACAATSIEAVGREVA